MKRTSLILLFLVLIIVIIANGCQEQQTQSKPKLSELQIEACNSADAAGTCDTRLAEVGIVLKEDCCKELGKCC